MSPNQSLALALTYVAQDLGIAADRTALEATTVVKQGWDVLTGAIVAETGQYGTYPGAGPAVMQFDNGNYYYVANVEDHQVTNTDYSNVDMALFGTPVAWARYELYVPKPVQMVYVTNEVDGITYKRLPTAPQRMYVINPRGADKLDFGVTIKTFRDFSGVPNTHKPYGAEVRVMGTAHHPIIPTGQDFYVDIDDWADFTRTGHVATLHGYQVSDVSESLPPPKAPKPKPLAKATPLSDVVAVAPTPEVSYYVPQTPESMHFRYFRDDWQGVRYRVMCPCVIQDYGRAGKPQRIVRGKTVKLLGSFYFKGRTFLLPALDNPDIPRFKYWYGIPEVDGQGNRIVEELPDYSDVAQTVAEAQAELPTRRYNLAHYLTYYQEKLSHGLEKRLLKLKGK